MSGITKEIRSFLFYSRVQLILFKDNANEWNNKRNTKFSFLFPGVAYLIYLKSASNLNGNLNCSKELEHYAS